MKRNVFKISIIISILLAYFWIIRAYSTSISPVCLFKKTIGIPCPGCGGIRSTICISQGNILDALYINPLSVIVNAFIIISIFWLLYDLIRKKNTFIKAMKTKWDTKYFIIAIIIILINWIWNIYKGL
ncbi:MAG: DUF2752 domain-containing protein [Bacteroidales bacterium]